MISNDPSQPLYKAVALSHNTSPSRHTGHPQHLLNSPYYLLSSPFLGPELHHAVHNLVSDLLTQQRKALQILPHLTS